MTEAEWLTCEEPKAMLDHVERSASERKLRLFVCGCFRVQNLLVSDYCRDAIEKAEEFADGRAPPEDLSMAWRMAEKTAQCGSETTKLIVICVLSQATSLEKPYHNATFRAVYFARLALGSIYFGAQQTKMESHKAVEEWNRLDLHAKRQQSDLLRDIIGNPFTPMTIDPSWLTPNVVARAQQMYANRTFDQMPEFASALEQAGCTSADILAHFRQPAVHVRGCCVLDLILRKE